MEPMGCDRSHVKHPCRASGGSDGTGFAASWQLLQQGLRGIFMALQFGQV